MITCATRKHFQPDAINPAAGMGRCLHEARHGYWHPDAKHICKDVDEKPQPEKREQHRRKKAVR